MKRRIKVWPVILLAVFIVLIICLFNIFGSLKSKKKISTKVIDKIEKYNYELNANESNYYKNLFKDLKKELAKEKINEEKYASILSQIFITDFFSLSSSINKNDVGGKNFVYSKYKDTFIKKAKDTIYLYVENNMYETRKQNLPTVKKVIIENIKNDYYEGEKTSDKNAYYVECKIKYEKDLGYQEKVNLIIVHSNNKLEIVSME